VQLSLQGAHPAGLTQFHPIPRPTPPPDPKPRRRDRMARIFLPRRKGFDWLTVSRSPSSPDARAISSSSDTDLGPPASALRRSSSTAPSECDDASSLFTCVEVVKAVFHLVECQIVPLPIDRDRPRVLGSPGLVRSGGRRSSPVLNAVREWVAAPAVKREAEEEWR
jgi:hypothetical protein